MDGEALAGPLRFAAHPDFPQISYRRSGSGRPEPVLRGTAIHVKTLYVAERYWGLSASEIAEEYELGTPQVNAALAFARAHEGEIVAAIEADEALAPANG